MAALRSLGTMLCFVMILASPMLSSGAAHAGRVSPLTHKASSETLHPFAAFVTEASRRFGVPEHWIRAVMHIESGAKQRARSSKGAMGLMQIMPKTWTELRARHGLGADPYDPHDNILAGTAYIRELNNRYGAPGSSPPTMPDLDATNAIWRRVDRCRTETQAYVATLTPMIKSRRTNVQVAAVASRSPGPTRRCSRAHARHFRRRSIISWHASEPFITHPHRCRSIGPRPAVGQPVRASCQKDPIAMIEIALHRTLSRNIACFDVRQWGQGDTSRGLRDKSADVRRADMAGGVGDVGPRMKSSAGAFSKTLSKSTLLAPSPVSTRFELTMRQPEDDLRIRPGRIRDKGRGAARLKSFVGQVMRAARKAGHTGKGFGREGRRVGSRFGRGRSAALALSLRSPSRRVVIKARVVRHRGNRFRSAPLTKHISYLKRDGVTRDGGDARMFDARSELFRF